MKLNTIIRHGRLILLSIFVAGLLWSSAILLVYARNGGLSLSGKEGALSAIEQLAGLYFPPLSIMGAYYFAEVRAKKKQRHASSEAFFFSTAMAVIASFSPPIVLMSLVITGDALEWIRVFSPFTQSIVSGAISYYFARGLRHDSPTAVESPQSGDGARHKSAPPDSV